jgi:transcriptional regulator with XRE-family HTH domain
MAKSKPRRGIDARHAGSLPDRVRHARRRAGLSQTVLAAQLGVVPSAVAQWEARNGTTPTVAHLGSIASATGVAFEWLATGRGAMRGAVSETPALEASMFAHDATEERLLIALRRLSPRRREALVEWLEKFA